MYDRTNGGDFMARTAELTRKTGETNIRVALNLDGNGTSKVNTGIGFLDHMLILFARHGFFDLEANAIGDLQVDSHHTVEDVGIVLGNAIKEALGDKAGIKRYGNARVPMDEALAQVDLDISGRAFLVFNANFVSERLGDIQCQMFEEFFRAVAFNAGITLHIQVPYGNNDHHIAEAIFKAFAKALDMATGFDSRVQGVLSTKGSL